MNNLDFYREFGNIDEDLIFAADIKHEEKKLTLKRIIIAAGLTAIMLTATTVLLKNSNPAIIPPLSGTAQTTEKPENTSLFYNEASNIISTSLTKIPGHFWQEIKEDDKYAVFGSLAKKYSIDATANFSKTEEGVRFINVKGTIIISEDLNISLTVSAEEIADCCIFEDNNQKETDVNGVSVLAGRYKYLNRPEQTYLARFRIADTFYLVKMAGTEEHEKHFSELVNAVTLSNQPDFSAITPIVPELKDERLTLDEAFSDETFGSFVPKIIPSQFSFESAHRFINQDYNYLSVLWCENLNHIGFQIGYITDYERKNITLVKDTANYDLSLYPIPRGETVPEELWDIVEHPVFAADELSADVISKRVTEHIEDGEATKKISFSILTENNIVISVDTSGIEPEELYNMIVDILKTNR